jgi:hypothetical protein
VRIAKSAPDPNRPFENLLPLVELLVSPGNAVMDAGFVLTLMAGDAAFAIQ